MLDVIAPNEQLRSPDHCILRGGPCGWSDFCPIHDTWYLTQQAFADTLNAVNLDQLAQIDEDIEHGRHTPNNPTHTNHTTRRGTRT